MLEVRAGMYTGLSQVCKRYGASKKVERIRTARKGKDAFMVVARVA